MLAKHSYVTLIDLPEALPFAFEPSGKVAEIVAEEKKLKQAEAALLKFVRALQTAFRERLVYIGEDVISEKYYRRWLCAKGGFVEIMTGVPVVIVAHFTDTVRAKRFADALKAALGKSVKRQQLGALRNMVELHEEEGEEVTFSAWERMHAIRKG